MTDYRIGTLRPEDGHVIRQAADMLVEGFQHHWPDAWPDRAAAMSEVHDSLHPDRICLVATSMTGDTIGLIGGISHYNGNVWEIHPMVIKTDHQGKGIGRALVSELESRVVERGGLTLWVGTDDESNATSIGGKNIFPEPLRHLISIRNISRHPYEFYQKLGFELSGIMPDANGFGKPDIFLTKRVAVAAG